MATSIVQLAAAGDTMAFARIVAAYHADMIRVGYTYYKQSSKEVASKFLEIIGVVYPGDPPKER